MGQVVQGIKRLICVQGVKMIRRNGSPEGQRIQKVDI